MASRIAATLSPLVVAWRESSVRFGFLGSVCILLGSLSPAYLPAASRIRDGLVGLNLDVPVWRWVGTVLTMVGLGLLLETWLRLRPARRRALGRPQLRHWAVLVIVAAPLLLGPPTFSHDAYSYAAQGWMLQNNINPYEVGPGVLPGQFADQVAWIWRDTPAPYGPLALRMNQWIVWVAGFDPYLSAVLMRLPSLFGVLLIGWSLPRIASKLGLDPAAASWFGLLNPILIIDFIGGAHNDAQMVGLMLLGIWVTMKYRQWWLGAVLVGVAASIKQPAFLAAVTLPFLVKAWDSWRPGPVILAAVKALSSLAIAVAVFAGMSVVTGLGFGWINAVTVPGKAVSAAPFNLIGHGIQLLINPWDATGGRAVAVAQSIGVLVAVIGIGYLAFRHLGKRPVAFLSWAFLLFAATAPALHSWYLIWGGVLYPVTRPNSRRLRVAVIVTGGLLGFAAIVFAVRNGLWVFAVLLLFVIWESMRAHELSQNWEAAQNESAEAVKQ